MRKMNKMTLILTVLISSIWQIKAEQKQCYAENTSPYSSFDGTTSYLSNRGSQINLPQNCNPVYVWGIFRHGTRYPTKINIIKNMMKILPKLRDEIILNHEKGRGNLCEKDLENLKNWKTTLTPNLVSELAPQGVEEFIYLAKRMKEAFPKLFEAPSKDHFMFQSSNTNRTINSALAFTNELMGTNFTTINGNNIAKNDKFLRLYHHCPNFYKYVNASLFKEITFFTDSALWLKFVAEVSIRLGYLKPLSYKNLDLMYSICAYESAWHFNTKPPFCAPFTSEDLKMLEYYHDLHMYHTSGYGNADFIKNMGCAIVKDMILTLSEAAKNIESVQKGKFLFSHAETIVPTTVKLGLYKDLEELKLENYEKMVEKRKWRTAHFEGFASNIIAALCRCSDGVCSQGQNVVVIHQNERPVVIPQCSRDPCTLEELRNIFEDVLDEKQCNMDFCKAVAGSSKISSGFSFYSGSNVMMCLLFIKVLL